MMNALPNDDRLTVSIEEAAKLLGVSRATAYAAATSGHIPVVRVGRRLLVPKARLMALIDGPAKAAA